MGVSTSTIVKFYTHEREFVNKYDLDDKSDDYAYKGLICDGGSKFNPEHFGEFTEDQKEIMKIYFDEESGSVAEGYATVTSNIQDPAKLIPIWIKIRTSTIKPFQSNLNEYHNTIKSDFEKVQSTIQDHNMTKKGLFSKKENIQLPTLPEFKTEHNFKHTLWRTIWMIDSISKVLGLLIVAKENKMLVEITAADF